MLRGFFGNLIFAIIAPRLCGYHLNHFAFCSPVSVTIRPAQKSAIRYVFLACFLNGEGLHWICHSKPLFIPADVFTMKRKSRIKIIYRATLLLAMFNKFDYSYEKSKHLENRCFQYLRAIAYKYRESHDRKENSDFLLLRQKDPFGELFSELYFQSSSKFTFLWNLGKFEIWLNQPRWQMEFTQNCTFQQASTQRRELVWISYSHGL